MEHQLVLHKETTQNKIHLIIIVLPILVATRSKGWVCGRLYAGIAGSNPATDIDVCLL
jgi:hypothetical protein